MRPLQNIPEIPSDLKLLYRTSWEIKQRALIDMAADRGAFIDQSQSFNVFVQDPNYGKLSSMHFYGWKKGLKTGMYYLRSKAAVDAIKFTVDQQALRRKSDADAADKGAADNHEACGVYHHACSPWSRLSRLTSVRPMRDRSLWKLRSKLLPLLSRAACAIGRGVRGCCPYWCTTRTGASSLRGKFGKRRTPA